MHEQRRGQDTHSAFILARPQKAPSVSLLMLFLWSFSTSRLLSPWKVSPSMSLSLFLFSSLPKPSRTGTRGQASRPPTLPRGRAVQRRERWRGHQTADPESRRQRNSSAVPVLTGTDT